MATRSWRALPPALLLLLASGAARTEERFEKVALYLEQNTHDGDAEVLFEAVGGDEGLATLRVTAPDGRTVIDFTAPQSKLGIRHVRLESPEPASDGRLLTDFPAGTYRVSGVTVNGAKLRGAAELSHKLPEPAALLHPRPDQKDVPITRLKVAWRAAKNLAGCIVIVEHEATGRELRADLLGSATMFDVPDGFLRPGMEYRLAIGTVSADGNKSFIEAGFTTESAK